MLTVPHDLAKETFAYSVAQQLNAAAGRGAFDELVVVAPAHNLGVIRGGLDVTTPTKIIGMLVKDLVKTPDNELWPHVRAWVRSVHRTVM